MTHFLFKATNGVGGREGVLRPFIACKALNTQILDYVTWWLGNKPCMIQLSAALQWSIWIKTSCACINESSSPHTVSFLSLSAKWSEYDSSSVGLKWNWEDNHFNYSKQLMHFPPKWNSPLTSVEGCFGVRFAVVCRSKKAIKLSVQLN